MPKPLTVLISSTVGWPWWFTRLVEGGVDLLRVVAAAASGRQMSSSLMLRDHLQQLAGRLPKKCLRT